MTIRSKLVSRISNLLGIPLKEEYSIVSVLLNGYNYKRSVQENRPFIGEQICPWYTYPTLEFINQFDYSSSSIFEWGAGNSSIYWATRCHEVVSVEDDSAWLSMLRAKSNIYPNLHLIEAGNRLDYVGALERTQKMFDVIIIDGKFRYSCAAVAGSRLKMGGFIILDNSDWCPKCAALLREQGLTEVDFTGFGPVCNFTWTTSLFISGAIKFKTSCTEQPSHKIGSCSPPVGSEFSELELY